MDFVNVIKKHGYPIISKAVSHNMSIARRHPDGKVATKYFSDEMENSLFSLKKYKWLLDAPFRYGDQCCTVMKKNPSHRYATWTGRKSFVGTMAQESKIRYSQWLKNGCNAFDIKNPSSSPLSFWTEQDILQYIKKYDLKIADVYGDVVYKDDDGMIYDNQTFNESMKLVTTGEDRTGCVFCMFGIKKDTDRFLRLKKIEPKKYDYLMRGGCFDEDGMWVPGKDENGVFGLGYKFVIDWLNEHGGLNIKY